MKKLIKFIKSFLPIKKIRLSTFEKKVIKVANGRYYSFEVRKSKYDSYTFHAYISGLGWTEGAYTIEEAINELKKMDNPTPPKETDVLIEVK